MESNNKYIRLPIIKILGTSPSTWITYYRNYPLSKDARLRIVQTPEGKIIRIELLTMTSNLKGWSIQGIKIKGLCIPCYFSWINKWFKFFIGFIPNFNPNNFKWEFKIGFK